MSLLECAGPAHHTQADLKPLKKTYLQRAVLRSSRSLGTVITLPRKSAQILEAPGGRAGMRPYHMG
jgi:hypothetical protein